MENTTSARSPRIEVVDALRGFAVMAIILLHNIEHFNLYNFPQATSGFMQSLDKGVWDTLFFLFAGKAYAIFALLFGFSFFIQQDNQEKRGKDFRLRFLWRLVLLFGIGCFNAAFFPGEILVLYSIVGLVLIPVCKLSNRTVLAVAVFLMLQPMEWAKFFYAMAHPEYVAEAKQWLVHCQRIYPHMEGADFWAMVKSNLWDGQLFSLLWAWGYGRFFQVAALFMLGMLLGRHQLFLYIDKHKTFWKNVFIAGLVCLVPLYILGNNLSAMISREEMLTPLSTIVSSLRNFSFMCVWVALFVIVWQYVASINRMQRVLVSYGKMSLSNYLTQSIVGSFIYYGYGLSLYDDLGTTASFALGILLFFLQLGFCHWWLKHHRQGPFEGLWRKATWVFS